MPVSILTTTQRESYGRYFEPPSPEELSRFFHINDGDRVLITQRRGNYNKVGFALQLVTVRFIGTFLEDPLDVPSSVVQIIAKQLGILKIDDLCDYREGKQRWEHKAEICVRHGYREITDPEMGYCGVY